MRSRKPDPISAPRPGRLGCCDGRIRLLAEPAAVGQHLVVVPEPLIYREELTATLFAISDLNENVREILAILRDEDDGEETEADG